MPHCFSTLAIALTIAVAAGPAMAQASATHDDASGAVAGRHPHRAMRPVAATPTCGRQVYLPAGKLPTYGQPHLDPKCRADELARVETRGVAND